MYVYMNMYDSGCHKPHMMERMMIHTPPGTEFLHGRRAEMHEDGQGARHAQDAPVAAHDSRAVYYRYAF